MDLAGFLSDKTYLDRNLKKKILLSGYCLDFRGLEYEAREFANMLKDLNLYKVNKFVTAFLNSNAS